MKYAKVPERIQDIETGYWYPPRSEPDLELRSVIRPGQMLMVASPDQCPQLVDDFNKAGGLVLLYISTYKAPVIEEVPDGHNMTVWEGGSPDRTSIRTNPFWKAVDLTGHPEWMLYDGNEKPGRPFEDPDYMRGWYSTTPLARGYREAVLEGIQKVAADPRFDGIMHDNFNPTIDHDSMIVTGDTKEQTDVNAHRDAFLDLAEEIRRVGDEATSKDHFWIVINGHYQIDESVQNIADALMMESVVYSWAWPGAYEDDKQAYERLMDPKVLLARGGRVVAMPYFGFSGSDIAEDARRVKKLTDKANAIFADCLTLARPEMMATFARNNWQKQGGAARHPGEEAPALRALRNQAPGNIEAAREIY